MNVLPAFLATLAILAAGGCTSYRDGPPAGAPPDLVLLISLDTLRADRLGSYGYSRDTSPHLDRLADEGARFETVAAQATQTLLSHKSLFSSKRPQRLAQEMTGADLQRLTTLRDPWAFLIRTFQLVTLEPMLARLRLAGYTNAAFTDSGWMTRQMGFAQGWDVFDDRGGHFEAILPRVLTWLRTHPEGRRFVFVHAYDTHCPYQKRAPYDELFCDDHGAHVDLSDLCGAPHLRHMELSETDLEAISNHYDGGIASADAYVGEFFDALRESRLYAEALIVVTSDHGESLAPTERIGHGSLRLPELLVPLIVKFPSSWRVRPTVVKTPAELIDVMPTLLAAAGVEPPPGIQGRSMLGEIGAARGETRDLIAQMGYREGRDDVTDPSKRALLRPQRWLFLHDVRQGRFELFDLARDPRGQTRVSDPDPALMTELLTALASGASPDRKREFADPGRAEIDAELQEHLRALGYIDH